MRLISTLRSRLRGARPSPRPADAVVRFEVDGVAGQVAMRSAGGRDAVAAAIATTRWDSFERPLPQVMALMAKEVEGAIYDVGANTGFYALLARHLNRRSPIRAFEPYPPVLALLRENVALNGDLVDVVPLAVSARAGEATLYIPHADHGLVETSASLDPAFKQGDHGSAVTVPVTTLDDVNASHDHEPVSLVKIDVEGMEHAVLAGAVQTVERHRPWLVVEVLPTSDIPTLEAQRAAFGYVDVQLHPDAARVADEVEWAPTSWNHLWVPAAAVGGVVSLLGRAGLATA